MSSQRTFLGLVLGSMLACAASADTGKLRWRGDSALGLRPAAGNIAVPCGSIAFPCQSTASSAVLYSSVKSAGTISLETGYLDDGSTLRMGRPHSMNISVVGKTGVTQELGVYGRVATSFGRPVAALVPATFAHGPRLSYGLGVNWELSGNASATAGVDEHEFQTVTGDWRELRIANLGLKWRY